MLSAHDLDSFVRDGFVIIRGVFPRMVAEACASEVLRRVDDPALDRHREPGYVHLKEGFDDGPFSAIWNERFAGAVDALLGTQTYRPPRYWGWWPVSYPGHAPAERVEPTSGWHVDGDPTHHLDDPDRAVICLCLFTDIARWGGGTFIEPGSHRKVIRFMAGRQRERGQVLHHEINDHMHAQPRGRCVEITGSAGDIVLMHRYAWHCRGHNYSERVRIVCNARCDLDRRLDLARPVNIVERSIAEEMARCAR